MKKNAQIAMEFLILTAMAFAIVMVFLVIISSISTNDTKNRSYYDMADLGISLQQEILLAIELEDGYTRKINLPATLNGIRYNATIGQASNKYGYLILSFEGREVYYTIPYVNGTIHLGDNLLVKTNNTLRMT